MTQFRFEVFFSRLWTASAAAWLTETGGGAVGRFNFV